MDVSTVLSVLQTVRTAIDTLEQLKATFSVSHQTNELERFRKTVNTIQSVLKDADGNQGALSYQETNYIEELKEVVYEADDVLDEFVTLLKQRRATEASDKVSDKVRSFLPHFSLQVGNISDKVKDVNNKLDDIASNSKFMFKFDNNKSTKFKKQETSSFVSVKNPIIGRGEDLEKIVEMLLGSDDVHQPNDISSLAIVGMGGLGKTSLAQLVYNDPRITSAFQLKSWTCIADQDEWNLTHVLRKIVIELLGDENKQDLTSLEHIHHEIRKKLEGKKYLLVLDDVWNENYLEWQELEKYLVVGESGSRIVVTTRSKKTARIVGGDRVHELQGLSEEESWNLFERVAFLPEQIETPDDDLVRLGKDIVEKCINVPLAIRVVGSLLHGESKAQWLSFRDKGLANISKSDDSMIKILSLSYHQLDSSLKSCFSYCAIFPKDFVIDKQMLIRLWMAQGYINVESVGEDYSRILLQRCFFQDVIEDQKGEIRWFKIHDHLHDIAEQAAGKEICRLISEPINVDRKVRHISFINDFHKEGILNKTHIRTCFQVEGEKLASASDWILENNLVANMRYLRSLDLSYVSFAERLPKSIGKLIHLRDLNLSYFRLLKELPKSITELVNFQTLNLYSCLNLEELPKDMCKLADLSTLNIGACDLNHMPSKMDLLTNLHTLTQFVVGGKSSYKQRNFSGLEALRKLNSLKGFLQIRIENRKKEKYVKKDHGEGGYLIRKVHLDHTVIDFIDSYHESIKWEEALVEDMQPHEGIRKFGLNRYNGETMPQWPRGEDNSTLFYFPNLVSLKITYCNHLRFLHSLEKLPNLKELELGYLPLVEYMVNVNLEAPSLGEGSSFFPSLEDIHIYSLDKLKGWWPGCGEQNEQPVGEPFPCFGQLKKLSINHSRMLKTIPVSSCLNSVEFDDDLSMSINDAHQIPPNFKCLLPSESKSRMIAVSYIIESLLAK